MQKIYDWLVYSSANAENYSATIKGLVAFVPTVVVFLTLIHVQVPQGQFIDLIDGVAIAVSAFGTAVTAMLTAAGMVRKIYATFTGTNDLLIKYYR